MSLNLLRDVPGFLYLASPYTLYRDGREFAFTRVRGIAKRMRAAGLHVYSPIEHSHPAVAFTGIDPLDPLWMEIDHHFMKRAGALVVARMEGWRASCGIAEEFAFFASALKPIFYLDPETMHVEKRAPAGTVPEDLPA